MTTTTTPTEADISQFAIAVHEAGHAVAGVLFGAQLNRAAVFDRLDTQGRRGLTEFATGSLAEAHRALVAYAGPWAEAKWTHGRGGAPTMADLHRVMGASGRRDGSVLCASGIPPGIAGTEVTGLLTRCWTPVKQVAKRMFVDGAASHADVCAALGLADNGGPGSVELALIRAGHAPGSFTLTRA